VAIDVRIILFQPAQMPSLLPKLVIRPYPTEYVHTWNLADGTLVTIRPIRPEDEPLVINFHKVLSQETVHLRYFGLLGQEELISHERLLRICFSDYDREIVLVVERMGPCKDDQRIIALARLIKVPGASEAESAIVVSDDWQRKGLGTKLLGDLVDIGRAEGLERIFGHILPENYVMKRICRTLGFQLTYDAFEEVVRVDIDLSNRSVH
jgi:acetyltransferase